MYWSFDIFHPKSKTHTIIKSIQHPQTAIQRPIRHKINLGLIKTVIGIPRFYLELILNLQ